MATINDNLLVSGARGKVGGQLVYRRHGENTVLTSVPRFDPNQPVTASQEKARNRFADASAYARGVLDDPGLKKQYQAKAARGQNAYNIALRDCMHAPEITHINADTYTGLPGSVIIVHATDDFRVVQVDVCIVSAEGVVLEEGEALLNQRNLEDWIFTARLENPSMNGCTVIATARDLPENTGSASILL